MALEITKAIVDVTLALLKAKSVHAPVREQVRANIDRHTQEALAWSGRIQFYGMAAAEETDATTLPLTLTREPRRFSSARHATTVDENMLLTGASHYLLLGNIGAGKTTTLKRITRKLLLGEPVSALDTYQYPVVVICRELGQHDSLFAHLARILSIPFSGRQEGTDVDDEESEKPHDYWCHDEQLDHVLARVLNESRSVVIVDGLDEVPRSTRDVVDKELEWLARNLVDGKILASARTGDYTSVLEGLDLLEICPLSPDEVRAFARASSPDYEQFLDRLAATPYSDIVDRPLILSQLLFIYKRYGDLPEQPAEIYRSVVEMLFREWDAERRITRKSKYSQFDARRKMEFLAAIAYELTYRIKVKTFSVAELSRAYVSVCDRFSLPKDEMAQVVAELETHTGLIAYAGAGRYEFSHLSLQEYLCADYLVRDQFASNLVLYIKEYPGPVAVAVSLASNPSASFAAIVLRFADVLQAASLYAFLSRLLLERPLFSAFDGVGHALLALYRRMAFNEPIIDLLNAFTRLPTVLESLRSGLTSFRETSESVGDNRYVSFERVPSVVVGTTFPIPERGYLPQSVVDRLREPRRDELLSR